MNVVNGSGQTARDIAEFWLHRDLVNDLSQLPAPAPPTTTTSQTSAPLPQRPAPNYFCESPLNRMSHKRTDKAWLDGQLAAVNTVFILFADLELLASVDKTTSSIRPVRFTGLQMKPFFDRNLTTVFLGVEEVTPADRTAGDSKAWFTVDVTPLSADELRSLMSPDDGVAMEKVSIHPRMLTMPRSEAAIVGQARSMLAWHDRNRFCVTCGSPTELKDAGYKRQCVKSDCRSNAGEF